MDGLIKLRDELAVELEDLATAGDSMTRGSLIMEIRAGTGGDEAALFAKDLYDMYMKFCEEKEWKVELLEYTSTELGGIKEAVCSITGEGAFHQLQFESGGHRVQRVPETETQGRVHTSAATVAVLQKRLTWKLIFAQKTCRLTQCALAVPAGRR